MLACVQCRAVISSTQGLMREIFWTVGSKQLYWWFHGEESNRKTHCPSRDYPEVCLEVISIPWNIHPICCGPVYCAYSIRSCGFHLALFFRVASLWDSHHIHTFKVGCNYSSMRWLQQSVQALLKLKHGWVTTLHNLWGCHFLPMTRLANHFSETGPWHEVHNYKWK